MKSKFNQDFIWGIIGFIISSILSVVFNIVLVKQKNFDLFGVFNQVNAFFLLFSQLSVFGIHLAIQKYIPENQNSENQNKYYVNSLVLCFFINLILLPILYLLINSFISIYFDNGVITGLNIVIIALLFMSFNKISLQFLNGKRLMREYSIFGALRWILMFIYLIILIQNNKNIFYCFLYTEFTLFLFLLLFISKKFNLNILIEKSILKNIFTFGKNIFWGNLIADVNTRVDILVLGIFVSNELVGVYSFVALFYEGMQQILVVVRNNVNPIITKLYYQKSKEQLARFIQATKRLTYKRYSALAITSMILFPLFLWIINETNYFWEMNILFIILMSANIISSGYQPFYTIFNQIGEPRKQSLFFLMFFSLNLLFNVLMIPFLGIYGAGTAITISCFIIILYLQANLKKYATIHSNTCI